MPSAPAARAWRLPRLVRTRLDQPQHRTSYYLTLNNGMGAATGILFWLLLARVAGLGPSTIGVGYTVVALAILVGTLAKGGFDTALLLKVPSTGSAEGHRLLWFAFGLAATVALALTLAAASTALALRLLPGLDPLAWALVGAVALLMLLTWLQDAYFLARGHARMTFERNLVLTAGRLLLPLPVVLLALAHPVPLSWGLALLASALAGAIRIRSLPVHAVPGTGVPRRAFLRTATRNISGGAAEALPGLLLAPLVLALEGAEAAAYFGIAWTAASLLFQVSAVIGRSALAQMARGATPDVPAALRKGVAEHLWVVAPLAILVGLFAAPLLSVFGPAYAREGSLPLVLLCASVLAVAPVSLHLAVLRSRDRGLPLVVFPVAMLLALAATAPVLGMRYGLAGIAVAWVAANVPFGVYAAWRLRRELREVTPLARPSPVAGRPDLE